MSSEWTNEEIRSWLQSLDPYVFEKVVGYLWKQLGYSVDVLKGSNDRGIDVIAEKSDPFPRKQLIQVKKYSDKNTIGSKSIREYRTLYDQEPNVDRVVLITTGYFTSQATELAQDLNVNILNGDEISSLLRRFGGDLLEEPQESKSGSDSNSESSTASENKRVNSDGETGGDTEATDSDGKSDGNTEVDDKKPDSESDDNYEINEKEIKEIHAESGRRYTERIEEYDKKHDQQR